MSVKTICETAGLSSRFGATERNTFIEKDTSAFAQDGINNRVNAPWKRAENIIVSDDGALSKGDLLLKWRQLTDNGKYPGQYLYFPTGTDIYEMYDCNGTLIDSGALGDLLERHGIGIKPGLENAFKNWLSKNGVSSAAKATYVDHLKAMGEPMGTHTATGRWPGFFQYLTGVTPSKGVYDVADLKEFDEIYGAIKEYFHTETQTCTSYGPNYAECYAYSHDSRGGDQRALLNAYKKYREFLASLRGDQYLAAIRTKPFILLAGISGTGKSRLVRQLAQGCCPNGHELGKDQDGNADKAKKPGNFEMIPVRPNWHDSTELMGYVTRLTDGNKPKYVIKPFVKFLVKAAIYKDVPFFLCLDEMNLAPVEQYFAEYLSIVETRKKDGGKIVSDVLVNFDLPEIDVTETVRELMKDWITVTVDGESETVTEMVSGAKAVYDQILADKGIRIPPNFIVMGTVNMDETTCSFSRKVLDRAMTFELNDVNMDEGLAEDNSIRYGSIRASDAFATDVEGFDFYTANKDTCEKVKDYLIAVNKVLDGTPFKFAYRSRNEIMLYCIERTKGGIIELPQALDEATSMKVLSRIEGDEQKLQVPKRDNNGNVVKGTDGRAEMMSLLDKDALPKVIAEALKAANGGNEPNPPCTVCSEKLAFMAGRLESGFTNFFV